MARFKQRTGARPRNLGMPSSNRGDPMNGVGVGAAPGGFGTGPHMQIGQQGKGAGMTKSRAPQMPQTPTSPWGTEGNAFNAGSTMDQIQRNEYLNTLPVGGQREQAMNQMGYWSGGQSVQAPKGYRPPMSQYTEPGMYQAQAPNGAYAGITTVGNQGKATYTPLGGGQGGGRTRPGGFGEPRPGGGGRPGPQVGGQGGQRGMPEIGGYPQFGQNPPPNFLPNTPGWEAARAGASGDLLNAQTQYNIGNQMVPAILGLQNARLDTDRAYAARDVDENLAGRGLITSGIRAQDQQRKVAIPYGRQYQDLGLGAAGQYADLASQYGGANLGYNQNLFGALGQRANDAYAAQPLGMAVGQYQAPDMARFTPTYKPSGGPKKAKRKKKAGGKK